MKKFTFIILLLTALIFSGCATNDNDGKDALVSTTGIVDVSNITTLESPTSTSDISTASETDVANEPEIETVSEIQSCISFDSRNQLANDSFSEEQIQMMQYQIGTFNFIPVYFNDEMLCSDTYDEFCSLMRSSSTLLSDREYDTASGVHAHKFIVEGGGKVLFNDKEPVCLIADAGELSPIQYKLMGVSLGDTVSDINRLVGTEFVEYPTLRTLVIRDADKQGYAQFTLDEDCKIIRMEFKFGAAEN